MLVQSQRHSTQTHLDGSQARVVDGVRRTVVPAVPADMLRVARIPGQLGAMRSHEIPEGRPGEVRDRARGQVEVGAVKVEAQQQAPGGVPAIQESTEGLLLCYTPPGSGRRPWWNGPAQALQGPANSSARSVSASGKGGSSTA